MARIDSLLSIVLQQGANELRVGTGREPKMLAYGAVKRLHMPETDEDTLRGLLGDILSPEREQTLRERGRIDTSYEMEAGGRFSVTLTARGENGFDAVFLRASGRSGAQAVPAPRGSAPVIAAEPAGQAGQAAQADAPSTAMSAASSSDPIVSNGAEPAALAHVTESRDRAGHPAFSVTLGESSLVSRALGARASDLHLIDGDVPMIRVDGKLLQLDDEPLTDVLATLGLEPRARALLARGRSIELSVTLEDNARARVHVYRSSTGNAAAIRFIGRTPPSLSGLNMPVPLDDLIDIPHGLVLICGATGSGKSTTLGALAQEALRRRSVVLMTLEDPIEYILTGGSASIVRQRQVGRDVPDFASGLRDALREDPDILIVGEMRDPETIALALTAAETGHLVIATLHSGSTASAIDRIVDSYPPERQNHIRTQVADALRAVVAQRILPRARGNGRIPAVEVLRVNHAAAALIREGKTVQLATVLQSGRREGNISLERSLADRVNAGEVRIEHARAAANDLGALTMYLTKPA